MINPYLLEQLLAFYRTGTLSAAAEELFISQPALSQSMQKLEEQVGVPLFVRQKNKTAFNENGLLLADYAQKILDLQAQMLEAVRGQAGHQSELRLASIAPGPLILAEPILKREFPDLTLETQLLEDEEQLLAGLEENLFDIIIWKQRSKLPQGLQQLPYFTERLAMRIPHKHPLADKNCLTFEDLAGHNILLRSEIGFWMNLVKKALPTANFLYMDRSQAFNDLANIGLFPTFISDIFPMEDSQHYQVIPLEEEAVQASFAFCLKAENLYKWQGLVQQLQDERKTSALKNKA